MKSGEGPGMIDTTNKDTMMNALRETNITNRTSNSHNNVSPSRHSLAKTLTSRVGITNATEEIMNTVEGTRAGLEDTLSPSELSTSLMQLRRQRAMADVQLQQEKNKVRLCFIYIHSVQRRSGMKHNQLTGALVLSFNFFCSSSHCLVYACR